MLILVPPAGNVLLSDLVLLLDTLLFQGSIEVSKLTPVLAMFHVTNAGVQLCLLERRSNWG